VAAPDPFCTGFFEMVCCFVRSDSNGVTALRLSVVVGALIVSAAAAAAAAAAADDCTSLEKKVTTGRFFFLFCIQPFFKVFFFKNMLF
jgi:predicted transporter